MASVTQDEGFHEIQLNGKQLVFLFMAVTVVSVVIFLCGVLVGRGVRIDRGGPTDPLSAEADIVPAPPVEVAATPSSTPVAPNEKLDYPKTLEATNPPADKLEPPTPPAAKSEPVPEPTVPPSPNGAPASIPAPAATVEPPAAKAAPAATGGTAFAEPAGPGLAIQVAAFRVRDAAEALAERLISKDYKAYIVPPSPGAPPLYRVRVGKFKEQREADQVVARLKKEEKFEPAIVR
jgi:cell division septation protein DedD